MDGGLSIALIAVTIAAAAASAYGAYASAQQQQDQLKENAARRMEDEAQLREAGEEAARRQRKKDESALDSFAARAAARGVVAREGSSLLTEVEFAEQSELEAQHVKHGYDLQARVKRQEAADMRWQAKKISPEMELGKSLLASAGSIAGSYGTGGMGGGPSAQTGGGITNSPYMGTAHNASNFPTFQSGGAY
jgi:hypothetical protein